MQHFTPQVVDAARPCRHGVGARWFVDETYVKVAGVWRNVYRAVDQHGQVIDVYVSERRDTLAARRFFTAALSAYGEPEEVVTDLAQALKHVIDELLPAAFHNTAQYANNRVECDHGRLKARLQPMRGLKTNRTAAVIIRGHCVRSESAARALRPGVYARNRHLRLAVAFDELAQQSDPAGTTRNTMSNPWVA